ncbi:MAG TPA: 8-oxo-dGTP diphosphatase MutT [Nitrospiraceae bacterium]|jgi:mutator protein MutT
MPTIEVAAGVISRAGRYLIARRKPGMHLAGLWEFPGGKREKGETLEECLRRELWEELHIKVDQPVPFQTIRHEYPEKTVELHFFRCMIASGRPTPIESTEIKWVYPHQLKSKMFPPADGPVIVALRQQRKRRPQ